MIDHDSMREDPRRIFQAVTRCRTDRVLVITGADLSEGVAGSERHPLDAMHPVSPAAIASHERSKSTIAKISGAAVGAGMNPALG